MSEFRHIIDGRQAYGSTYGLIYTRKCGWIDLGHAYPENALQLFRKIQAANVHSDARNRWFFHSQAVRVNVYGRWYAAAHFGHIYRLKVQLTPDQLKSVALGIFMDLSVRIESVQELFSRFMDSGFSAEDLVSNLLGFYRAVEPWRPYIRLCEPVSLQEARDIWHTYGPVGANKNRNFAIYLYPTRPDILRLPPSTIRSSPPRVISGEGPMSAPLPWFLNTIRPEAPGILYDRGLPEIRPSIEYIGPPAERRSLLLPLDPLPVGE